MSARVSMISNLEIHEAVADELLPGEKILWSSRTDPTVKIAALSDLKQRAKDSVGQYLSGLIFIALLVLIFPFFRRDPQLVLSSIALIIALDITSYIVGFWRIQRRKLGGYALTRQHLFELDEDLNILRKLDASTVKFALKNDQKIVLAPLGKTLNSGRALYWLPDSVNSNHIQASIDAT